MQRRRIADHVFEPVTFVDLLPQRSILLFELAFAQRAHDQQFHFVEIQRFSDEIVSAAFHRFDRGVDRAVSRHHDANRWLRHFQRAIDQLHAVFGAET